MFVHVPIHISVGIFADEDFSMGMGITHIVFLAAGCQPLLTCHELSVVKGQ